MRSTKHIQIIECHAEGEVGDVIIGGVAPPPGDSLRAQRQFLADDGALRDFVLNEPRGGVFRHMNLLVPPKTAGADAAFLIMEPVHTPPMSGSNTICVATVLLEAGILPMTEPETRLTLEVPAGLIAIRAACRDGRVERIALRNVPSFADRLDAPLEVPGLGTLRADIAWGGDSFVIVDAAALGFALTPDEGADLVAAGMKITRAANEQLGFSHPDMPEWAHISFCQIAGPIARAGAALTGKSAVAIEPGKLDRSPTGTGCSARLAVMRARGEIGVGEAFIGRSILDSQFHCRILEETTLAGRPAIIPEISGRAWIAGSRTLTLDPADPWPRGYRVGDTWPNAT